MLGQDLLTQAEFNEFIGTDYSVHQRYVEELSVQLSNTRKEIKILHMVSVISTLMALSSLLVVVFK